MTWTRCHHWTSTHGIPVKTTCSLWLMCVGAASSAGVKTCPSALSDKHPASHSICSPSPCLINELSFPAPLPASATLKQKLLALSRYPNGCMFLSPPPLPRWARSHWLVMFCFPLFCLRLLEGSLNELSWQSRNAWNPWINGNNFVVGVFFFLAEMWSLVALCVFVCTLMILFVCLFVWVCMNGFEAMCRAFGPHWSIIPLQKLEHSLTVVCVTLHLSAVSAQLLSCPPFLPSALSLPLCPLFLPCLLLQGSGQPFVQLKLLSFVCAAFFILVLIAMVVCLSWTPYFTLGSPLFDTPPLIRIPILGPLWYWNPTAA